nr:protein kinase-like domain-containing protein [Tanacetum cinerariifolium]GEZ83656.1 protein kinase-like domain-containing protein [Tanacetum cinerariifolium]
MERFSAAGNPIGGSIPDTLGHWKSLTGFYCGGCNLYGSIPHSIFNLSVLVNFSLPGNHLSGSLPSKVGNQLPNLKWLQLRTNELTGVLPPSISNCSKLEYLEMSFNNFSGKLAIDFSKLRDIYSIKLQDNNFHGRGEADDMKFIHSLRNCTKLGELVLSKCNLIGVLPISIEGVGGVIGPHKSPYTKSKGEVDLAFSFFENGALLCFSIKQTSQTCVVCLMVGRQVYLSLDLTYIGDFSVV